MRYILLFLLTTTVNFSFAQNSEDSVRTVVQNLFFAMKSVDTVLLKSSFADIAILQTIVMNSQGIATVRDEQLKDFVDFISKEERGNADERIIFEAIKIDGPLAFVWTPYEFYYKEKFGHCGVNSFQLVKFSSGWKIQYLVDTRRKDNCK
jgi:hypothetical protein